MNAAPSLYARLLALAAAWVLGALLVAGVVLTGLFRDHAEGVLARRVGDQLDALTAALEVGPDGAPRLAREPADPLFHKPLSGLYWLVAGPSGPNLRSRSTWDQALELPADQPADGETHRHSARDAAGRPLVAWERTVRLPRHADPLRVAILADATDVEAATADFARTLALSLAVLAAGLLAAAWAQVRLGLAPLGTLRADLAALRAGRAPRLAGAYPAEVLPLAEDLNLLLAENAAMVERARAQAGDLAHALKTPLAVIANAAVAGDMAEVSVQAARMAAQVERNLARARAAASPLAPPVPVLATLEPLARAVARLHRDRGISLSAAGDTAAAVRCDPRDLQEMVGNLLDNAAKWARAEARLTVSREGGTVVVAVEDDGPGIPPDRLATLPARGMRLDEAAPGSGLGLAITDELARLHGGRLALSPCPLGGLRATLALPSAG